MKLAYGIAGVVFVLGMTTLVVNAAVIGGTVPPGSNGNGFEQEFADAWNDPSSEFTCTNSSPFTVVATSGPCSGQQVMVLYDVNDGDTSGVAHNFAYEVRCHGNKLRHFVGFDADTDGPLGSIESGKYIFNLDGGDTLTALTKSMELPQSVPTLGQWGLLAFVGILVTSGIFVILRRNRPSPEAP